MTVSMRVMSAGAGYQYLLRSVVAGDGNRSLAIPLTRYYTEAGTPPGRWMGSGLHALGNGEIGEGSQVSAPQLELLLGMGRDPVTGDQLGRAYPDYQPVKDRAANRKAALSDDLTAEQCEETQAEIEAQETAGGRRRAVAGYDFTFSVPKSVSVLWGVADAGTQALIVEAHHESVAEVLAFLEREVATTRTGVNAGDGAVTQTDIVGILATAFDHWDSRTGDPQLHTHVVISNKVQTAFDGRWRSLDGRPMHGAVVAISEYFNAVLADRLTSQFGIDWEQRDRGKNHNTAWEIVGVGEDLVSEFSSRSREIEKETDRLVAEYVATYGGRPSSTQIVRLRAQATLSTRPPKQIRSLADLTEEWRGRAAQILRTGADSWARGLTTGAACPLLRADDISLDLIDVLGSAVVGIVSEKRSTWRYWNLWAEASRQTMGWRFATAQDREAIVGMVVDAATRESIRLTPPELATSPEVFRRDDRTSRFRPAHSVVFTSHELLAAEDRLLVRAADTGADVVDIDVIERVCRKPVGGHMVSDEQAETLAKVAVSGRQLDLLIGPAGAGKTTAMRALHDAWTAQHGKGSVVGLAPSAVAAQVLAEDLGVECENTAKWLHEFDHGRTSFRAGQLVIVDEATLAGTLTLDRISTHACAAGAKTLLVGDWAQLQSVDAGGAFTLLAASRTDTPELVEVRRFTHEWEKSASLELRLGHVEVIGTYLQHDRVHDGTTAEMIDAAYAAWLVDVRAGRSSVLVAEASQAVMELNQRARAERILDGDTLVGTEASLADDSRVSAGDLIITRRNDRRLHTMRGGWVRNGERWRVAEVNKDGSVRAERIGMALGGFVLLPAAYVAEHVDLGYAVTAHRAQGITVDTAHVVVSTTTTRENLYVSMTRGRNSNIAYVALDKPDDSHTAPAVDEVTARTVLYGVLRHSGAELSAHQMIEDEQERWSSIAQVAAEYETIAAVAQRERWFILIEACGLSPEEVEEVIESDSFGPLTAELRRAEANHYDVDTLLPKLVTRRSLDDAEDVGAVLISRLRHETARPKRVRRRSEPKLIAGLIPVADGPMTEEMSTALVERQASIESRAQALAEEAVAGGERWLARFGLPPGEPTARADWMQAVTTVAGYRDRYLIGSHSALGDESGNDAQRLDAARAERAIRRAQTISCEADERETRAGRAGPQGWAIG